MASTVFVIQPEGVVIPCGITDLEAFRSWALSDAFPERGRIDYLAGEVDIDMSPEDVTTHGTPKMAIAACLQTLVVDDLDMGVVLSDRSRVSSPRADLSAEPDVLVVLYASIETGRVRLIPKANAAEGRYVELEGAPDLVVECVSDSSVAKDTRKLLRLYHEAGVREYWLVDARRAEVAFAVHPWTAAGYVAQRTGRDGFTRSTVLGRDFRLLRREHVAGLAVFRLEQRLPRRRAR